MNPNEFSRPWRVYLLSDVCTDYTWAYDSVCAMKADDAALLKAELEAGTSYNLVHSRQVEYFLEAYPYLFEQLIAAIRNGQITLNPVRNMTVFADMSLEEIVRSFYPARRLARKFGLDDSYANIQETPTAAWILPTIFANIGVKHLVRSLLPYECPWAKRLTEPPIYWWEGPDGSRVLVRLRKEDYVEGRFVLKGVESINEALHTRILPAYESRSDYPFDAIGLVGCYGDLSPQSKDFPAQKAAAIAAYNSQGWDFPRLVEGTHAAFWADIERQMADDPDLGRSKEANATLPASGRGGEDRAGGVSVPVIRGDYGASWEAWPACLSADFAAYRRAQSRAPLADRLTALASIYDFTHRETLNPLLESAWNSLLSLADHAWNGSSDASRKLNATLRRQWQQEANAGFDAVIAAGLQTLARRIPTKSESLLAFNHQSWPRTALARLTGPLPTALNDPQTGALIPVQTAVEYGQSVGYCVIPDVPGVGYRVLSVADRIPVAGAPHPESGAQRLAGSLDSPFYTLTLDPTTGAVASLYDKTRGVELVDPASRTGRSRQPYRLNEAIYTTAPSGTPGPYAMYIPANFEGASEQHQHALEIEAPTLGPVFDDIKVRAVLGDIRLTTTYRLYHALDRLDIRNEVDKPITTEKQQLDFVFPFQVPERRYRIETPGVIIDPESDRLPGAGQAVQAVRRFVDVFNAEYGVTLSMLDSGLVQFGHGTTAEDPLTPDPSNATVLCLALGNVFDWNEAIRDQGGATHFVYRYSLRGHGGGDPPGGFDPVAAIHFGWEDDLPVQWLPAGQRGDLPADQHSFVNISPVSVILTGLRRAVLNAADEGGLALRLWNLSGQPVETAIAIRGLGHLKRAIQTDLLETDLGEDLPIPADQDHPDGIVYLNVPGRGLGTLRVESRAFPSEE